MTTSLPLGAQKPSFGPNNDSIGNRILGVIRRPRRTFSAVAERPRWLPVLALTFIVSFIANALFLETDVGRLALVDQWERTAVAFGQDLTDDQYATLVSASDNGVLYALVSAAFSGPVLVVGVSALVFVVLTGLAKGQASYRQVLGIAAYAGVILALRQVIAAPLNYARETLASPTTMTMFFSMLDEASAAARFFGMLDLFVLWWIVVLAVGIAQLYQLRLRPTAIAFLGAYVGLALVVAFVMVITGGTA